MKNKFVEEVQQKVVDVVIRMIKNGEICNHNQLAVEANQSFIDEKINPSLYLPSVVFLGVLPLKSTAKFLLEAGALARRAGMLSVEMLDEIDDYPLKELLQMAVNGRNSITIRSSAEMMAMTKTKQLVKYIELITEGSVMIADGLAPPIMRRRLSDMSNYSSFGKRTIRNHS